MLKNQTSLYFLGKDSSSFNPYQQLMESFSSDGLFLTLEEHASWLNCYKQDSQSFYQQLPLIVFQPFSLTCMASFIKACAKDQISIRVRCGGTGMRGGAIANPKGVLLLTGHFRSILEYDAHKGVLIVEPGVTFSQVREFLREERWTLPIEMATNGVAGLAGCLSTNAKGYHQAASHSVSSCVLFVKLIDGQGKEIEIPGDLACGAEGLLGVITQLTIKLTCKAADIYCFTFKMPWNSFLDHWPMFTQFQLLKSLIWQSCTETFIGELEGESWRLAANKLKLQQVLGLDEINSLSFKDHKDGLNPSFVINSAIPLAYMPIILNQLSTLCSFYQLTYQVTLNLLEETVHLFLSTQQDLLIFKETIQQFLVDWVHLVEKYQGFLISRHGVGALLNPFLPPFYPEEDFRFLKKLTQAFDSQGLFRGKHFFPIQGKSLYRAFIED